MAISDSYFTQIFRQFFYTNIPTVLSVVIFNCSDSHTFFNFIFDPSTRKFKAKEERRQNKLELLLLAAQHDELRVRLVSKDCGLTTQNVAYKI